MTRRRLRDRIASKEGSSRQLPPYDFGPVKLEHLSRFLIRIPAVICLSLFSWLKLKGIPFGVLTGEEYVEVIFQGTLFVWFWSWVCGASLDARNQSIIYKTDPSIDRNRLREAVFPGRFVFGVCEWRLLSPPD